MELDISSLQPCVLLQITLALCWSCAQVATLIITNIQQVLKQKQNSTIRNIHLQGPHEEATTNKKIMPSICTTIEAPPHAATYLQPLVHPNSLKDQ